MRWLAGKTHELAHRNWGERSMGKAIDLLYSTFTLIQRTPSLLLDYEFIMNIFDPLYEQLPEFEEYIQFYREEKMNDVRGSSNPEDRLPGIDRVIAELFWPTKTRNRETTEFCINELSKGIATVMLIELQDKACGDYLSVNFGKRSQAVISREEERASVGLHATNDPSEGSFATLTDVLCNGGRISLLAAAGIGQMRYNGDMRRNHELAVTGKKRMQDIRILKHS